MTPEDAGRILAVSAAYDQRTVGKADILAWTRALDGLDPDACVEAVHAHHRDSTDRLMPARVRQLVMIQRRRAVEARHTAQVLADIERAKLEAVPRPSLEGSSS